MKNQMRHQRIILNMLNQKKLFQKKYIILLVNNIIFIYKLIKNNKLII